MDFFDKLGKKATEAYKVTADKTGKIAKETKLKFKMSELKSKIEDIYEEIGKKVYEKHIKKEEISIESDLAEPCQRIDKLSSEIETLLQECLDLKDKKQCPKCYTEIDKKVNFCPECGAKQEEQPVKEVEIIEKANISENNSSSEETFMEEQITETFNGENETNNEGEFQGEQEKTTDSQNEQEEVQSNLEKTTQVEINPDAQGITEEEMNHIGK